MSWEQLRTDETLFTVLRAEDCEKVRSRDGAIRIERRYTGLVKTRTVGYDGGVMRGKNTQRIRCVEKANALSGLIATE